MVSSLFEPWRSPSPQRVGRQVLSHFRVTFSGEEDFTKGTLSYGFGDLVAALLKRLAHIFEFLLLHFIMREKEQRLKEDGGGRKTGKWKDGDGWK